MVHFNPQHPENMNVFVPDGADHALTRTKDGDWQARELHDAAKLVTLDVGAHMNDHIEEPYEAEYSTAAVQRFDAWYERLGTEKQTIEDTAGTIRTNSHVVKNALSSMGIDMPLAPTPTLECEAPPCVI